MKKAATKIILVSAIQALLIAFTCISALLIPGFYKSESGNWQAQSLGQDLIDCFLVVPVLIISSYLTAKGSLKAYGILGGVNFYLTYTYLINCFAVHFNSFFLFYCIILGLSFYSSLWFFFRQLQNGLTPAMNNRPLVKITGIYFITIAVIFSMLWVKDIIPSILADQTPAILKEAGLFTNPVHVIDLSVFLPGLFITGYFLLKKNETALRLAPAFLVFMILMNFTIGFLVVFMRQKGTESDLAVSAMMVLPAIFSFILLRRLQNPSNVLKS